MRPVHEDSLDPILPPPSPPAFDRQQANLDQRVKQKSDRFCMHT